VCCLQLAGASYSSSAERQPRSSCSTCKMQTNQRCPHHFSICCLLGAAGAFFFVASCVSVSWHNENASRIVIPPIADAHNLTRAKCRIMSVRLQIDEHCPFPGGQPYTCAQAWATIAPSASSSSTSSSSGLLSGPISSLRFGVAFPRKQVHAHAQQLPPPLLPEWITDHVQANAKPVNVSSWSAAQIDLYRHRLHAEYPENSMRDCICWSHLRSPAAGNTGKS
jgi:hypothetical protein